MTSKSDDYEEPLILPKHDYTVVEDDDPLILLADHRVEGAPYFGYFPPNKAVPEMVIIDRDSKRLEEAASWEVWKSSTSALERNESPSFVIQAVKGKGMAMIAARDIKMGELIHKEKWVFLVSFSGHISSAADLVFQAYSGIHTNVQSRSRPRAKNGRLLSFCSE